MKRKFKCSRFRISFEKNGNGKDSFFIDLWGNSLSVAYTRKQYRELEMSLARAVEYVRDIRAEIEDEDNK